MKMAGQLLLVGRALLVLSAVLKNKNLFENVKQWLICGNDEVEKSGCCSLNYSA